MHTVLEHTFEFSLQSFGHIMGHLEAFVFVHDHINLKVEFVTSVVCACLFQVRLQKSSGAGRLTVSIFRILESCVTETYTNLFRKSCGAVFPTKNHICSNAVEAQEVRMRIAMQIAPAGSRNHTFLNLVPTIDIMSPNMFTTMSFR